MEKYSFEHNESGWRTAYRRWNAVDMFFQYGIYYRSYDETFFLPTEIWNFKVVEGTSDIPVGYDYETNPDSSYIQRDYNIVGGVMDRRYTYYADGQGRIAKVREEVQTSLDGGYFPQGLNVYTYDGESGIISKTEMYENWNEGGDGSEPGHFDNEVIEMTFDIPDGSGFEPNDLLFEPWKKMLLPYTYQDVFLPSPPS